MTAPARVLAELVRAARARAEGLPRLAEIEERPAGRFARALRGRGGLGIIAELKRRSPSRGALRTIVDPVELARDLADAGACALSVLTEPTRFGGSLEDLARVAAAVDLPVLMKDFVVHERQLLAAASRGAAAVLLIVRLHDDATLGRLLERAGELGLDALVECHDEGEVARALRLGAEVIGVNNRDLDRFTVDVARAERLLPRLPADRVRVAESGYVTPGDLAPLRGVAHAALIGTGLMAAPSPAARLRELLR